jgi:hypothetical protein
VIVRFAAAAIVMLTLRAAAMPVEVPFTRVGDLVVVTVRVNGSRELAFVLDTGSARMVLASEVSGELGLAQAENDTIGGAGAGRVPVHRIHNLSIEIGGIQLAGTEFVATDLQGVSALVGHRIDGILGYDFFSRFVVVIDYTKRRVQLHDPQTTLESPGEAVPIRISKGWPFVQARLQPAGLPELTDEFLIDSGSNDAVDHPIAQNVRERAAITSGNGLGRPVSGFLATATRFTLGSFELRDLSLASGGASEQTSKLIGGAVLSRFTVTFDYPHSRMFLKR